MTIAELEKVLEHSWCKETAYHLDRENWSNENKTVGQCTVTAMIVYDYFGGEIKRGYSSKYNLYHYWNEIGGERIDLTKSQFNKDKADICFSKVVTREKRQLLKIANVKKRYIILKEKIEKILANQTGGEQCN